MFEQVIGEIYIIYDMQNQIGFAVSYFLPIVFFERERETHKEKEREREGGRHYGRDRSMASSKC